MQLCDNVGEKNGAMQILAVGCVIVFYVIESELNCYWLFTSMKMQWNRMVKEWVIKAYVGMQIKVK